MEGGFFFFWRMEFFKIGKHDFTFIREMRVHLNVDANFGPKVQYTLEEEHHVVHTTKQEKV